MTTYFALFISAFVAATLMPALSELALAGFVADGLNPYALWLTATIGNTLGGVVNWGLGRYLRHWESAPWFPMGSEQLARAESLFARYGVWTLLFAWLPIIGDPLTFIAGVARTRFSLFITLIALGKGVRYLVIILIALQL